MAVFDLRIMNHDRIVCEFVSSLAANTSNSLVSDVLVKAMLM